METTSFLPPVAPAPEVVKRRMEEWYQAMELSNAMLLAGLRRRIGPDGDLQAAYREWYREHQDRKWAEISEAYHARLARQAQRRNCE